MLLEKLRNAKDFTNHEKDLAQFILANLDKVPEMSADELAKRAFTSKATVVRLSQKLGLSGYHEFRIKLVAEVNQKKRISDLLVNEPITGESSYEDIIKTLPVLYDKAVTNTRISLDKNCILRIMNILRTAECIDLYGVGIAYILAQAAAFKFETLGIESSAHESINAHYLSAKRNKKGIAFLISFTGANRSVIRMAQYLREATRSRIVGILGPHNEEMKHWCHDVVEIPNRDSLLSLDVVSSFAGVNYVIDIFFSLLLAERYEEHAKSSLEMLNHMNLIWNQDYNKLNED
ncbi:MAG: MurR/RpiR family transcriptional regulator [Lachnospiraceae bacterium]